MNNDENFFEFHKMEKYFLYPLTSLYIIFQLGCARIYSHAFKPKTHKILKKQATRQRTDPI